MATPRPAAFSMGMSLAKSPAAMQAERGRPRCAARKARPAPLSAPGAVNSRRVGKEKKTLKRPVFSKIGTGAVSVIEVWRYLSASSTNYYR